MEGSVHLYCTSWINISLDLTYINDSHLVTLAYKEILKDLNFPLKVSIAKARLRSPGLVSLQALHRPALGSHVWKNHNKLLHFYLFREKIQKNPNCTYQEKMGKYTAAVSHYYFLNLQSWLINFWICMQSWHHKNIPRCRQKCRNFLYYLCKEILISSLFTPCFHEKSNTNSRYLRIL